MEKYKSYKESGIEWIGEIPEQWGITPIKYLAEIRGRIGWRGLSTKDYVNDGYVLLGVRNISKEGKLVLKDITRIPLEKYDESPEIKIQNGDILLAKTGATIGKSCVIEDLPEPMTVNAAVNIFRLKTDTNPKYFNYLVSSPETQYQFELNTSENARGNLFQRDIAQIRIPFTHKKKEQDSIVDFLDNKVNRIDKLITDKKQLLKFYTEEKSAIINQVVTKGLNPDVPMKESGIEWLGIIPAHWDNANLKWLSKIYAGGTPSRKKDEYWMNGTIPWLNSGTVNQFLITEPSEFITEEGLEKSSTKWIPKNSLVIALAGQGKTKGMVAQVMLECTCNQSLGVIVPNGKLDNRFLLYYLTRNYQNIRNLGGGDKRDGINLEMVGSIPIPILPLEEQRNIVEFIEKEIAQIEFKMNKTLKLIELLSEYRTALISEVVTGKIKVTD